MFKFVLLKNAGEKVYHILYVELATREQRNKDEQDRSRKKKSCKSYNPVGNMMQE